MILNLHCTCGAYRRGHVADSFGRAVIADWDLQHSGEGHEPCDTRTAQRARAKAERDYDKKQAAENRDA